MTKEKKTLLKLNINTLFTIKYIEINKFKINKNILLILFKMPMNHLATTYLCLNSFHKVFYFKCFQNITIHFLIKISTQLVL